MRLIELRLKNLNSLKGEWHIDFTDTAFTNEGIFAITGQTGAGKTTILDAICLALYGETPRINSISKSSNEVMTRQTAECFAEVVIEINTKRYRCHWGQRRAHNKAHGNLQDATHEITNADTDKILESGIKKTKARIQNLVGMDFNQFTRSIMLAQGSFAAFLKSDVSDRAAILEKITGTAIYAQISKNVFEKKRYEENQLAKLQVGIDSLPLLSDEDEVTLQTELSTHQQEQTVHRATLKTVNEQLQWLNKITDLQRNLTHYQGLMTEVMQAQKDFGPEASRLDAANKALEIDSPFKELLYSRKYVQNLRTEQAEIAQKLPTQQQYCKQVVMALNAAITNENQAATALNDTLSIIVKVRRLDSEINQQAHSINDDTDNKNKLSTTIEILRQEIKSHQQTESDVKNQLSEISDFSSNYQKLGDLDTDMVNFDTRCGRLKTLLESNITLELDKQTYDQKTYQLQSDTDKLSQQLESSKSSIAQQRTQLATLQKQQSALINHQPIASMRAEQAQAGQLSNQVEQVGYKLQRLAEIADQIGKAQQIVPTLNNKLNKLEDLITRNQSDIQDAKNKQQEQQTHLQLLQRVARLEDYIIELKDGTPCPLCGAHEHPYSKNHPLLDQHADGHSQTTDKDQLSQIQRAQQQITDLKILIENLGHTLAAYKLEQATTKAAIHSNQQQAETLQNQAKEIASDIQPVLSSLISTRNTYTHALTTIISKLATISDFCSSATVFDIANITRFITLLNNTQQQVKQQQRASQDTLMDYDSRADDIATLSNAIDADEKKQQFLIDNLNSLTTEIRLLSQKTAGIDDQIKANFSELSSIMMTVSSLVDKYPAHTYNTYLGTTFDATALQSTLTQLYHSIEKSAVLPKTDCDDHIKQLRQQRSALKVLKQTFNEKMEQQNQLSNHLSRVSAQIDTKQQRLVSDDTVLKELENSILKKTYVHQQSKADRHNLFADKNPDSESNRLQVELDAAKNNTANAQRQTDSAAQVLGQLQAREKQLAGELDTAITTLDGHQSTFSELLLQSQFASEADFEQAQLSKEVRDDLKIRQLNIDQAFNQTKAQLQATQHSLDEQLESPLTEEPRDVLAGRQQQLQTEIDLRFGKLGAIEQQLKANEAQKIEQSAQSIAIAAKKETMQVWQQLYELIGQSDGKKYRTFAQGLTFQVMISHANIQLEKMSNRYLLVNDENSPLELNIIDNYQGGEIRSTKNLSGGEGFIISLALALGLSQMASQNIRVDSLFLDEGFGTLDEESLDIALDTLTSLQQEGKLIGVISHVQALKDRILTQIKVEKLSGGFSQISGQGCRRVIR